MKSISNQQQNRQLGQFAAFKDGLNRVGSGRTDVTGPQTLYNIHTQANVQCLSHIHVDARVQSVHWTRSESHRDRSVETDIQTDAENIDDHVVSQSADQVDQ